MYGFAIWPYKDGVRGVYLHGIDEKRCYERLGVLCTPEYKFTWGVDVFETEEEAQAARRMKIQEIVKLYEDKAEEYRRML